MESWGWSPFGCYLTFCRPPPSRQMSCIHPFVHPSIHPSVDHQWRYRTGNHYNLDYLKRRWLQRGPSSCDAGALGGDTNDAKTFSELPATASWFSHGSKRKVQAKTRTGRYWCSSVGTLSRKRTARRLASLWTGLFVHNLLSRHSSYRTIKSDDIKQKSDFLHECKCEIWEMNRKDNSSPPLVLLSIVQIYICLTCVRTLTFFFLMVSWFIFNAF